MRNNLLAAVDQSSLNERQYNSSFTKERIIDYKGGKSLPTIHVLKPWGEARKGYASGWFGAVTNDIRAQTPVGVLARTLSPKNGGLWDPTSVGEENEILFIRAWKPLPTRRVLRQPERESPERKISASSGLRLLHVGKARFVSSYVCDKVKLTV